jgi:endogenous inhibitor of DNA gyrase (YacG/DUF329 family)
MADLGNWALERYRIAGEPVTPESEPADSGSEPAKRRDES